MPVVRKHILHRWHIYKVVKSWKDHWMAIPCERRRKLRLFQYLFYFCCCFIFVFIVVVFITEFSWWSSDWIKRVTKWSRVRLVCISYICNPFLWFCIYICCSHLLNESPGAITFNAVTLNSTDIFGIKLFISEVICPLLPTVFVVVMLMLLDEGGAPFFFFFFFLAPLPATLFPTSASACVQVLYPCSKTIE